MIDIVMQLGFSYVHNGCRFVVIPLGIKEPEPHPSPEAGCCLCPIAAARGAETNELLYDRLSHIMSGAGVYGDCPQCEGMWFFAESNSIPGRTGHLHHISGDTLARFDNLISPMRLEYIMQAFTSDNPPRETYRNDNP